MLETTLVLLKPPAIQNGYVGNLITALEDKGLRIKSMRTKRLNGTDIDRMYGHVSHLPFFPDMKALYTSADTVVIFIDGHDAIQKVRALIGPHNNLIHASDSPEAFAAERLIFE